jgi:TolB-like protein/DNA-binding SARP family transcriptional activator/Tfp pilus assembly protein PilF
MKPSVTIRLRLFGSPSLSDSDGRLCGPEIQRHRLALLALLTLAPGRSLSRDKLLAYLWPERDTDRARQLLNQAVYRIRKALGDESILSRGEDLQLNLDVVSVDVADFESAVVAGDDERAVALHQGPFLDGFFLNETAEFEQWVTRTRDRLAGLYAQRLEALAEAAEARGDHERAIGWWKASAAHDPLDSRVAVRLIQALDAAGNRAAALRHATVHERLLQEEMGIEPAPEVAALVERLRREPPMPPPIRSPEPPRKDATDEETETATAAEPGIASVEEIIADEPLPSESAAVEGKPQHPVAARVSAGDSRISSAVRPRTGRTRRFAAAAALLFSVSAAGLVWSGQSVEAEPERSIVVLPFANFSAQEANEYFSDGLTEEIITRLAAIPTLKVISRTSAMHYKGSPAPLRRIAEELNVAHVLEGSVRESEGRLRITTQLIDAATDEHRWAASYDFEPGDVFRVQEEIARQVASALQVQLAARDAGQIARQAARNPEVYELYRRGRYHWSGRTAEGHARAMEYYQRAIELDSTFADAYAGLADAYVTSYQLGMSDLSLAETNSRLRWAAERALALDDQSSDAHTSFALSLWWQPNWPGAERELRRALELNPGNGSARSWLALLLRGMGKVEESLRESRIAAETDPFALIVSIDYANACYIARDYDCAIEQFRRTAELDGEWAPTFTQLGIAHSAKGMHEDAIREVAKAVELRPGSSVYLADLAYVHAKAGRRAEAADLLRRAKSVGSTAFQIARAHVALSESDSAFVWLERVPWQWPHRAMRADPALDSLRDDPRWAALTARVDREMGVR